MSEPILYENQTDSRQDDKEWTLDLFDGPMHNGAQSKATKPADTASEN